MLGVIKVYLFEVGKVLFNCLIVYDFCIFILMKVLVYLFVIFIVFMLKKNLDVKEGKKSC